MIEYKVYFQENGKLKIKNFRANNIKLLKENIDFPNNVIKIKKKNSLKSINIDIVIFKDYKKLLLNSFKQINTMLQAKLTFNSAIKLFLENKQDPFIEKFFSDIDYIISNSYDFHRLLKNHEKHIDKSVILFLELGLQRGNIKQAVSSLVNILDQDIKTTKQIKDTLRYPFILIISVISSLIMIFNYVIPNFEFIFKSFSGELPVSTKLLISFQNLISDYWYIVLIVLFASFGIVAVFYKRNKKLFHKIYLLKIPFFSKVVQSYLYYKMFLSLYIIVNSKYQFQIAIEHSKDMTQNIYLKGCISDMIIKIKKGKSIATAFEDTKLFDNITIQLLYTAQHSNRYDEVLSDLTIMYKQRFQESIKNFISIINPILILIISLIILWIILAVMTPTWSLSSSL